MKKITVNIPVENIEAFLRNVSLLGGSVITDKVKAVRKTATLWEDVTVSKDGEVVRTIDGVTAQKMAQKFHNPLKLDPAVRKFPKYMPSLSYYQGQEDNAVTVNDDAEWSSPLSTKEYVKSWLSLNNLIGEPQ